MFAVRERVDAAGACIDLGFTDRHGGVSKPPFDTLNLGGRSADSPEDVRENFGILAGELEVSALVTMRQVHGDRVVTVTRPDALPEPCDALVTTRPGVALCVRVADCIPVLLCDPGAGVIAAVHAGRDGLARGVIASTIAAMRNQGAAQITAWVGPHICGGCYEVPAALRAEVAESVPAAFACTTWGTPALDIGAGVGAQLAAAGVDVQRRARCTRESRDLFSYRRDGAESGRMAGVIVMRTAA